MQKSGFAPPGWGKPGAYWYRYRLQPMFRFDHLIRRDMIIRDIKQQHPAAIPVLEGFGFRPSCDDCDIETVARKQGLSSLEVVDALNRVIFGDAPEKK
jgi:hypothetical protein